MGSLSKSLLFLLFVMATCDPATPTNPIPVKSGEEKKPLFGLYIVHMRILNNLGNNLPLTVHCKSRDDDLKTHVIDNNESFRWKFRPNLFRSTLFFCHFSWKGGEGTYDMYKYKRDKDRCKHHCNWNVTDAGIEGYTDKVGMSDPELDLFFEWQNP